MIGEFSCAGFFALRSLHDCDLHIVTGCVMTSIAPCLFALINTGSSYWAFGFPAAVVSVFGADFIFAGGSLFVAKVALPHEQSLAGGLFNTLTQVTIYSLM